MVTQNWDSAVKDSGFSHESVKTAWGMLHPWNSIDEIGSE
jgi:hypothetical protein